MSTTQIKNIFDQYSSTSAVTNRHYIDEIKIISVLQSISCTKNILKL